MTTASIVARAHDLGLDIADELAVLVRPALELELKNDSSSPLASRLGGQPALPASTPWPRRDGRPLACVAQINLAEVAAVRSFDELPEEGLLLFFYDADAQPWGFNPADKDGFAVRYVPASMLPACVTPWPDDLPAAMRFPDCAVAFRDTLTIPSVGAAAIMRLDLSEDDCDLYEQLLSDISGDSNQGSRSLFLGHPDQLQPSDLFDDLPLVTAGINTGGTIPDNAKIRKLRERAKDWSLLLQIESLDSTGMCWGDMGCLYFCIPQQALRQRDFDAAWVVLQCS